MRNLSLLKSIILRCCDFFVVVVFFVFCYSILEELLVDNSCFFRAKFKVMGFYSRMNKMVPCESWDLGQTYKQVLHTKSLSEAHLRESVLPIIRQRTSILSAISNRAEG